MSDNTQRPQEVAPWSDDRISRALGRGQSVSKTKAMAVCLRIIYDYQAQLAARDSQMAELEAQLENARKPT